MYRIEHRRFESQCQLVVYDSWDITRRREFPRLAPLTHCSGFITARRLVFSCACANISSSPLSQHRSSGGCTRENCSTSNSRTGVHTRTLTHVESLQRSGCPYQTRYTPAAGPVVSLASHQLHSFITTHRNNRLRTHDYVS